MRLPTWHPETGAMTKTEYVPGSSAVTGGEAMAVSDYEMCQIGFDRLWSIWRDARFRLRWTCPFILPPWLQAWSESLGRTVEPLLVAATVQGRVVGLAPLMVQNGRAFFLGHPDVCDHFDCAVAEGFEGLFFEALLDHLASRGVREVDLGPVRGDSILFNHLPRIAEARGMTSTLRKEGASYEVGLMPSWEEFLTQLAGKQRHEVRRKIRRLEEAGRIAFRCVSRAADIPSAMAVFTELFRKNRSEKAAFMEEPMEAFFQSLANNLAEAGLLRLFFLDLEGESVAATFCFDHHSRRYLYNNGYDEQFATLSVGLLSKVLSLRHAIGSGLACFDFLKGTETYKERLGSREVPLYQCRVRLKG